MLSCAVENLSAKRFAEYLSLGQVPSLAKGHGMQPTSLGRIGRRGLRRAFRGGSEDCGRRDRATIEARTLHGATSRRKR